MDSIKDLKNLLAESRAQEDERSTANYAYKLGEAYLERGKRDQALPLLEESFALCERLEHPAGSALVALSLATIHLRDADTEQAEPYAQHAYRFFENEPEPKRRVEACQICGDICWSRNDPEGALPYYRQALEVCRQHEDALGTATFLERMATQHRLFHQEEEARVLFREALDLWTKLGIPDRQAVTLANLADIHRKQGAPLQAIRLYEQALPLYRGLKNIRATEILERELSRLKEETEPGGAAS